MKSSSSWFLILLWFGIGLFSRLIPHLPNLVPLTCLSLLAPTFFSKRISFLLIFCILAASDSMLYFLNHYPLMGYWSIFNYTGFAAIVTLGFYLQKSFTLQRNFLCLFSGSLFFWLWTNFGTWLGSGMYQHTIESLLECYSLALPFLQHDLIASVLCMTVFWLIIIRTPITSPTSSTQF